MPPGCEADDWSLKTPAKSDVGLKLGSKEDTLWALIVNWLICLIG